MAKLIYHCPAGLSGDMNLGAMIELGVAPDALRAELKKLGLEGWQLSTSVDGRSGITGTRCDVYAEPTEEDRSYADIRELIEISTLSDAVKTRALSIFHTLAKAEAHVHGVTVEKVHFHEVGSVDSIVDIVGAAICWDLLEVSEIYCDALELGGGTVNCAHGVMPVPAPATAKLLEGKPVRLRGTDKEATTPTGAAILVGGGALFENSVTGRILKTGVGIGQRRDPNLANVCFVTLLEEDTTATRPEEIVELITNLDDMTGEDLAYAAEQLLLAGALDVWQTQAIGKKGRACVLLHALAPAKLKETLEKVYFKETRTLGVRAQTWNRTTLPRELETKETSLGTVKLKRIEGSYKIEFESLRSLAWEHSLSLSEVRAKIERELNS